ncbi:NUDIX hydrolase [Hespellia stercorisuis]|uniref:ADP-ribose pyrophosphatase n=1 Tax=Hespellia stercorisuis DSM 15480 TaxID=1121950 RepID=A0A1M6NNF0_9FIRM|nr:NUDIX hydrolase [Hespellia stercorisuis]SHJ97092.1 ADP-ribose pyrophosphatase [Hespellia stercorisuis DSM 15480]
MNRIKSIKKQTENRFLNLYELEAERRDGRVAPYFLSSRAETVDDLKIKTRKNTPDGVVIYGVYGEAHDKVALVKQFRYPIDDYIYEFPAGLVEKGENITEAAVREMYEETGLTMQPLEVEPWYQKPLFTTIGMTDEACGTVFGYLSGKPTNIHQEASEDIQVVLADRAECRRILQEENVAIMCAYMLMHFINSNEDPFCFLK